jgi:hypothetical protein
VQNECGYSASVLGPDADGQKKGSASFAPSPRANERKEPAPVVKGLAGIRLTHQPGKNKSPRNT